jgi:hypothetical protein
MEEQENRTRQPGTVSPVPLRGSVMPLGKEGCNLIYVLKSVIKLDMMVGTCNPSYSGG